MPAERIHWIVVDAALDELAGSALAGACRRQADWLLQASVFHDALYFAASLGNWRVGRVPEALHGNSGEDGYAILRMQLRAMAAHGATEESMACLLGLVSHIAVDVTMHPMVYHFSGTGVGQRWERRLVHIRRHLAFETVLDMAAARLFPLAKPRRAAFISAATRLARRLDRGLPLRELAQAHGLDEQSLRRAAALSFGMYAAKHAVCSNQPLGGLAWRALRRWPGATSKACPMFQARELAPWAEQLTGPIAWRHPVTGESHVATLPQLIREATDMAVAMCRELEGAGFAAGTAEAWGVGPSLATGLVGVGRGEMRFVAEGLPFL